ncbi:MAG: hypothetical protein HRT52_09005 [Colwellia sp.]|nr:hypothetical protein [Colwellia sp.]
MKALLVSILVIVAAGCSSNQTPDQIAKAETGKNAKESVGYQCEKVYPMGSSIPKKLCTTRAQRKTIEKQSKDGARVLVKPALSSKVNP